MHTALLLRGPGVIAEALERTGQVPWEAGARLLSRSRLLRASAPGSKILSPRQPALVSLTSLKSPHIMPG